MAAVLEAPHAGAVCPDTAVLEQHAALLEVGALERAVGEADADVGDPGVALHQIEQDRGCFFLRLGRRVPEREVRQAVEHGVGRVERAAHSLKGSAGNLGAVLVQKDCEELQLASRQHSLDAVRTGVTKLRGHYEEAQVALRGLLRKYS